MLIETLSPKQRNTSQSFLVREPTNCTLINNANVQAQIDEMQRKIDAQKVLTLMVVEELKQPIDALVSFSDNT